MPSRGGGVKLCCMNGNSVGRIASGSGVTGAWALGVALAMLGASAGASGPMPAGADWSLSDDGVYVIDHKARLAWPRCVEGMQWSGSTCTGKPLLLDHAQATALATRRWKEEGVRWRLPHAKELQRLVDREPGVQGQDPQLFPAAPRAWYWSGTASVSSPAGAVNQYNYANVMAGVSGQNVNMTRFLHGWAVNMVSGAASGEVSKHETLPVRLVRPMP